MATAVKKISNRVTGQSIREHAKRDHSPKWDDIEKLTAEEYTKKFREAMNWYRLECPEKTLKPRVIDWMGRNGYDRDTIQSFKKTKDNRCSQTVGAIASCLIKGMPAKREGFNQGRDTAEWLRNEIAAIIEAGKNDVEAVEIVKTETVAVPVVTIKIVSVNRL